MRAYHLKLGSKLGGLSLMLALAGTSLSYGDAGVVAASARALMSLTADQPDLGTSVARDTKSARLIPRADTATIFRARVTKESEAVSRVGLQRLVPSAPVGKRLEGCDLAFSPLARAAPEQFIGRCLT